MFKIRKLKIRMTILYVLLITLLFGSILYIVALSFNRVFLVEKNTINSQINNQFVAVVNQSVKDIHSLQSTIAHDVSVQQAFKNPDLIDQPFAHSAAVTKLAEILRDYRNKSVLFTSVLAIRTDGQILDPLYGLESYAWLTRNNPVFTFCQETSAYGVFSQPNAFPYQPTNDSKYSLINLTYYATYFDVSTYQPIGYLAINIVRNKFFTELEEHMTESLQTVYITDENQNIIYAHGIEAASGYLNAVDDNQPKLLSIEGKNYQRYTLLVPEYPNWKLSLFYDYDLLRTETVRLNVFIIALMLLGIAFTILISLYVSKTVTNPIQDINYAVRRMVDGEWPEPLPCKSYDEMKTLVDGFNLLTSSMHKLFNEILANEEDKRRTKVAMLQSQLDLLQNQINPHFIHNTLNTMHYLAVVQGNQELSEAIVAFNSLLRASMSVQTHFVTIKEEIGYMLSYMAIQSIRYGPDKINLKLYVEESVEYCQIPKLILQPLVENAIFHGILPTKRHGNLSVTCLPSSSDENYIQIYIADDGVGIEVDKLDEIMTGKFPNPRGYSGIGLLNVKQRLELYYGDTVNFKVSSQPRLGTMVSFQIPCKEVERCIPL